MHRFSILFFFLIAIVFTTAASAQQKGDTVRPALRLSDTGIVKNGKPDTVIKKKHDPHKATMHSLILPGWGQAYNRKYWKIPIVYAALGITGGVFNFNRIQYNKVKFAYFALINKDTASYKLVDPELQSFITNNNIYGLQQNRNYFRKNIDYSALFFLFFWALNVVDATVDGHLKDFNVSSDLSLKVKPNFSTLPNSAVPGVSVVVTIGKNINPNHRQVVIP